MTVTELAALPALMSFGVGLIAVAELLRPTTMAKERKPKPVRSRDEHLRECGWRIYSHPNDGPRQWEWRHGPGVWFHVPVDEAIRLCPLVLGGWQRTNYDDRGERVWILHGAKGDTLLVLRQSEAIAQAGKIMEKYADLIDEREGK